MAESGAWIDTKTGKVVAKQPEEGVQLIAPGTEPTDAQRAYVEEVKAAVADGPAEAKSVTRKSK